MRVCTGSAMEASGLWIDPRKIFFLKAVKVGCRWLQMFSRRYSVSNRYALTVISCQAQIRLNGTTLSIVGIRNGSLNGSKIGRKRVMNCVAMPDQDCSTWARQFSKCGIFSDIGTCKRHKCGTLIDCK